MEFVVLLLLRVALRHVQKCRPKSRIPFEGSPVLDLDLFPWEEKRDQIPSQ